MDREIIKKFVEISGIGEVGPEEALLGISEISIRQYEALRRKLWGDSKNWPEHSHWKFWDDDFIYIRTRPRRGAEFFIKIPSELVMKTVVLGKMPPNPMDSCDSDRFKETMKMKGELSVMIGKAQVLLDERPDRDDDLKEEISWPSRPCDSHQNGGRATGVPTATRRAEIRDSKMSDINIEKFWDLWLFGLARIQDEYQMTPSEVMTKYEIPLGARMVREVEEICDRVKEWRKFKDNTRVLWHAEGDKVFIRIQHRVYAWPKGAKYYGTSIQEFPLDLVEKVVVLGFVPPFQPEVPGNKPYPEV